jgi:hypothetical protein
MSYTKSDYLYLAKNFDLNLSNVAKAMDESNLNWFVVAGWALDLFVGKKTREHKDIEISVWRDQVPVLFESFPENRIDMVIGHKRYETLKKDSVIDKRGHLVVRKLSIENHNFDIELFTTERSAGHWIFRKQGDIQVPMDESILTSACGPQYLAPQLVLLYKAWFYPSMEEMLQSQPSEADFIRKCWETDCKDFETVLPLLSKAQKEWIHTILTKFTPEIPWLKRF